MSAASMVLQVLPPWSEPAHRAQRARRQMQQSRLPKHAENRGGGSLAYEDMTGTTYAGREHEKNLPLPCLRTDTDFLYRNRRMPQPP